MVNCPIKECGRKFQNQQTMLEHIKRRHPHQYANVREGLTKSLIEKEHSQHQQFIKLPQLMRIMSNQKSNIEKQEKQASRPKSRTKKLESANLSSIIKQSKITSASKKPINITRPGSLKKNLSNDPKNPRLLPIQNQTTKLLGSSAIQPIQNQKNSKQFYKTLPNLKNIGKASCRSIDKQKEDQEYPQLHKPSQSIMIQRTTMTTLPNAKTNQEISNKSKKGFVRPAKKGEKRISTKKRMSIEEAKEIDFGQRIVALSDWPDNFFNCPSTGKIELLYLNNCGLSSINLNFLESLVQFSATHNNLQDMEFLNFGKNHNIKVVHVDHNQIVSVYTPPKVKLFTASFNLIQADSIHEVCSALKKSQDLEEIDLSFNQIRKATNYKLKLLGAGAKLRKIDGLTVTKIDIEMMEELAILQSKQRGLIPLEQSWHERPESAISQYQLEASGQPLGEKSILQLEREQKQYESMILETEQQLRIITQENEIISSELDELSRRNKQFSAVWESESLLKKLQKQCQFLELLNILQFAEEEELRTMVGKKKLQLGLASE